MRCTSLRPAARSMSASLTSATAEGTGNSRWPHAQALKVLNAKPLEGITTECGGQGETFCSRGGGGGIVCFKVSRRAHAAEHLSLAGKPKGNNTKQKQREQAQQALPPQPGTDKLASPKLAGTWCSSLAWKRRHRC